MTNNVIAIRNNTNNVDILHKKSTLITGKWQGAEITGIY